MRGWRARERRAILAFAIFSVSSDYSFRNVSLSSSACALTNSSSRPKARSISFWVAAPRGRAGRRRHRVSRVPCVLWGVLYDTGCGFPVLVPGGDGREVGVGRRG